MLSSGLNFEIYAGEILRGAVASAKYLS